MHAVSHLFSVLRPEPTGPLSGEVQDNVTHILLCIIYAIAGLSSEIGRQN